MRTRLFSLCLLFSAAALTAQPAPPHVHLASGDLEGSYSDAGPMAFLGIPYAAPPTGENRWRAPQPVASWTQIRQAKSFGAACIQPDPRGRIPRDEMSEDCLYLNVWTPSLQPSIPTPVMVYLHGGGFMAGSGNIDGARLASHGAVVVTVNYRLGVFGFLAHPELTAESPHHASGNYGLMDQIAALRWVRANIAAFGGNPQNITVFGESAGATAIGYLLVSPLAAGAFDKAILESPSGLFTPDPERIREVHGLTAMDTVGLAVSPNIAALRRMPASEVMERADAAVKKLFGPDGSGHVRLKPEGHTQNPDAIDSPWWAFADGYVVPEQHARLYAAGKAMQIPVMVGTNADEGTVFLGNFAPKAVAEYDEYLARTFAPCGRQMREAYPAKTDKAILPAADHVVTDAFFLYGSFELARTEHGYLYRFSRVAPANAKTGATHGNEVRYVFGDTHRDGYESLDHRLSDQMMTTWVHFARTGDPRLMQSSDWTRIGSNDETPYMDFGDTLSVKQLPYGSLRVFEELWPASGKPSACEGR